MFLRVDNWKLVVGCGVTLCLKLLLECANLGLSILEAGVGKLVEIIHGGIDQMMDFGLFQLVGVWVGDGNALLVTAGCRYVIKIQMLITELGGEVMKEHRFFDAAGKH